jgi:creatinine amidohydrolase
MSSAAIDEAVRAGKRTAIIVVGSVEQHGPHLPCDTDSIYGAEIAGRVAHRLGNALVAPVIMPGISDHHLGFAGTFTISSSLLVEQVKAHIASLALMNFERVVLTSSHGGNFGPLATAEPDLAAWATDNGMTLLTVLSLQAFVAALRRAPAERGLDQGLPAVQADLIETSIMLHLRPDLVRMDLAEVGHMQDFDIDALFRDGLKSITSNGVVGDPRGATAELGAAIVTELEEYLLAGIRAAEVAA